MKRNCLNTNEPFKRGHVREDGYIFFAYTKIVKGDGYFKEIWLSPAASESVKAKDRAKKRATYQRKSQRHCPGFDSLPSKIKAAVHDVKRLHEDQVSHNDMTAQEIAQQLAEHGLSGDEWDVVVHHAGGVCFDLKDAIREALSM